MSPEAVHPDDFLLEHLPPADLLIQGERWTQITNDASGLSSAQSIWNMGLECAHEPPDSSVLAVRPGWPVECVLSLAGPGEPHDPADIGGTALRPARRGTPGRRRGMADIIGGELADMRGRSIEEYIEAHGQDACDMGDADPGPPPARLIDMRGRIPPDRRTHQAVERALAAAWSLSATTRPPGSVRIRKASPGKARLVRATGDGWTLIGRTDGPVVLLADAIPGLPSTSRILLASMSYSPPLPPPGALPTDLLLRRDSFAGLARCRRGGPRNSASSTGGRSIPTARRTVSVSGELL